MFRKGPPEPAGERIPNLAPMVDIIMVLLVFFMLGATLELTTEGVLTTELDPRSGPGEGVAVEIVPAVRIALEDSGSGAACNVYVMDEPLSGDGFARLHALLVERVRAGADTSNPVIIAAEPGVRWRYVVKAMDAAVRSGFKNVQFVVSLGAGRAGGP